MSDLVPTVKVKSTHPESQGDFVEINESDFDPKVHTLVDTADLVRLLGRDPNETRDVVVGELKGLKVDELKALAAGKGIDLGEATKKDDIIAKIEEAEKAAAEQAEVGDGGVGADGEKNEGEGGEA